MRSTVIYDGGVPCRRAGLRGYTVRVVPRKDGYPLDRFETGLVTWWEDDGNGVCPPRPAQDQTQTSKS